MIVNSPYEEPAQHWRYDRSTRLFDLAAGCRPAGHVVASKDSRAFDEPSVLVEIPKAEIDEATKWVGGLDRIDRARGILLCYDFSATPFAPTGGTSSEKERAELLRRQVDTVGRVGQPGERFLGSRCFSHPGCGGFCFPTHPSPPLGAALLCAGAAQSSKSSQRRLAKGVDWEGMAQPPGSAIFSIIYLQVIITCINVRSSTDLEDPFPCADSWLSRLLPR